ncbi:hypothetical protein [Methylocella sp.]|uniref:hypothetical protein n=1 Tax=Methylocella sp. TaxID=1978226 RepID=UPI0037836198
MRSTVKFALASLVGAWSAGAQAAVLDVTGYWKASADKTIAVAVERQFNTYRIAVLQGSGASVATTVRTNADMSGNGFSLNGKPPYTTPGPQPGGETFALSFSDASTGSLVFKGKTYALVRDEFVSQGLAAPIDPAGPETGWYAAASGGLAFVENQGASTKVLTLASGSAATGSVAILPKSRVATTDGLTKITVTSVAAGKAAYARDDFENVSTANPVPDRSAYSIPAATAKAIAAIGGAGSMRLRGALRERAAAYLDYLGKSSPAQSDAVTATTRDLVAYQCVRDLTPIAFGPAEAALDRVVFSSLSKGAVFLNLLGQLGTSAIGEQDVSASAPNQCSQFIQGLGRYFTAAKATAARTATPAQALGEQALARASRDAQRAAAPAAQAPGATVPLTTFGSNKSCTRDEYVYVAGLGAAPVDAKQQVDAMRSAFETGLGLPSGSLNVKAVANPNPTKIGGVSSALLNTYKLDAEDVTQFRVRAFAALLDVAKLPAAVAAYAVDQYARGAILADSGASSNIASILSTDVAAGYRALVVAHSQGNILADDAVEQLSSAATPYVGIAAVASTDDHVAGAGKLGLASSATRDDDKVVNAARALRTRILGPTLTGAGAPYDALYRHLFVDSYLVNLRARAKIVQGVKAAQKAAATPTTAISLGQASGGYTGPSGQQSTYQLGFGVKSVSIQYQMYSIPDAMDVFYRGERVATTGGPVSGGGTLTAALANDGKAQSIDVIVYGTDPGTAWDYAVVCPGSPST